MNIEEIIKDMKKRAKKISTDNPGITGTWWEFFDIPVDEMRATHKKHKLSKNTFYFDENTRTMILQYSYYWDGGSITCFFRSPKLKVTEHIVVEDAVKNV